MSAEPRRGHERCVRPDARDSNSQTGDRITRYELADHEWTAIRPMLPNKPRGVPRVSAHISTAPATGSSDSSTGSSNVVWLQRATTGLPPTTLPWFNLRQSGYGCALISPRRSEQADYAFGSIRPTGLD